MKKYIFPIIGLVIIGAALIWYRKSQLRAREERQAAEAEGNLYGILPQDTSLAQGQTITPTQTATNINAGSDAYAWNTGTVYTR